MTGRIVMLSLPQNSTCRSRFTGHIESRIWISVVRQEAMQASIVLALHRFQRRRSPRVTQCEKRLIAPTDLIAWLCPTEVV